MTIQKAGPLNWQVPIVDKQGRPSPEFIRYFRQLLQNSEALQVNKLDTTETLSGLSLLVDNLGLVEQTAADVFGIRALGTGAGTSVPTTTDADARYVRQDQTPAWADPSGTLARTTFAAYGGQTVSAIPTQAEVQAIDDHVKVLSQRLAALITDLRAAATSILT